MSNSKGAAQHSANKVELHTPEQKPAPDDSFLVKYREMKRWAAELPIANIGETARQTYKTLVASNRVKMPSLARAEIAELFREPVRYINSNMTKHYVDVGFPLTQKSFQAAQLAIELCNEIANAYKIILKEQLREDSPEKFNQDLVVVSIHRTLQYLGQSMFHTYLIYGDYQPGIWREIHFLYTWAAQNHVHNVPVKESSIRRWGQKNRSIEDLYKGFLLLATVGPNRLRQSQIRRIHERMPEWAALTKIRAVNDVSHAAGIFYINLWSDEPPAKSLSQNEKMDARYRAFDLNEILSQVRADYEQAKWESPTDLDRNEDALPRSLLRILIRGWNKSLQRKFARTQLKLKLDIVVGLNNLYRVLQAQKEPLQQEKKAASKHKDPTIDSMKGKLNWNDSVFSTLAVASPVNPYGSSDSIFGDSVAASTQFGDAQNQVPTWAQQPSNNLDELFSVLTYNESTEGYCLEWKGEVPPKVRVGDLLGFRSDRNPNEYGLAVIRWLTYRKKDVLLLGVQIISAQVNLAHLEQTVAGMEKKRERDRCLLLTGNGTDNDMQGIVTNSKAYSQGSHLYLRTDFGEHQIKLTQWVESSNSFIQYDFEYVEAETSGHTGRGTVANEGAKDGFDDLWGDL